MAPFIVCKKPSVDSNKMLQKSTVWWTVEAAWKCYTRRVQHMPDKY